MEAQARRDEAAAGITGAAQAAASAKADIEAGRAREEGALARLREVEETAAREQEQSKRELEEVRKTCSELQARADVAEKDTQRELKQGRVKLVEVVQQKDEMVR